MSRPNHNVQKRFHRNNRKKLLQSLSAAGEDLGLIVITGNSYVQASADRALPFEQDSNFFYLTGITESGVLLVIVRGKEYLVVSERSEVRKAFEGEVDFEALSAVSGIETIYGEEEAWPQIIKRVKKEKRVGVLMPAESYIAAIDMHTNPSRARLVERLQAARKSVGLIDLRTHLVILRMTKTKYEIRMIQQAIRHTQKLLTIIESKRERVVKENDLLAEITRYMIKHQLEYAYEPIIASGINAVTLHYSKNNNFIDKKGLLLLDIGLKYNGYSADITRTISYSPNKRQRQVYDAVLAVQNHAIALLKPGITVKAYEEDILHFMGEKLRELGLIRSISKESVRQFYPHATSHFLGIDVHDSGDYERQLEPGMILTVEPGIYIKEENIGIRIEDDVLITADGNLVLTNKLPRNLASLTIR